MNDSLQFGANVLRLSGWMNIIHLVPSGAIGVRPVELTIEFFISGEIVIVPGGAEHV